MGVYIRVDSGNQGPCPNGFHIPSFNEAKALVDAMTALGQSSATAWRSYLKIVAGGRLNTNGNMEDSSGYSWLWTTGRKSTSYYLIMVRNGYGVVGPNSRLGSAYGLNIRPFKDTPVVPDSSWTALYSNNIYWNSTLGLISVSSDGTNWITIADKNIGAENVNDIGSYFQWGNNYGFPQSGFNTSNIQVDVSQYGLGNYYTSDIFITDNDIWSTSINDNLWGGELVN